MTLKETHGSPLNRRMTFSEEGMLRRTTEAFFPKLRCYFCGCHGSYHKVTFHEETTSVHMIRCRSCSNDLGTEQVICWRRASRAYE